MCFFGIPKSRNTMGAGKSSQLFTLNKDLIFSDMKARYRCDVEEFINDNCTHLSGEKNFSPRININPR